MQPRFRRLVVTSIPGADWDSNFAESFVESFKQRLVEVGLSVDIFSVRDAIYQLALEEDVSLAPRVIHRASDEKVRLLRGMAFLQLKNRLDRAEAAEVTAIITRATSYADSTQEESLSRHYLEPIKPDLLVVVIDDPVAIFKRLPHSETTIKYARELSIKDLVVWMRYEVEKMRELAHDLHCPLFVIPRLQVSAIVDLITTTKKTAYLSYPMSLASAEIAQKKKRLLQKLKEHFIVFDPECMGSAHDESLMTDDEQGYNRDSVKKRDEKWFITFNSEYVIVYLPDRRVPAHGSQTELDRASEQGKFVWVVLEPGYTDAQGRVSPFIDRPPDLTFVSSDELQYFLDLSKDQKDVYGCALETMWGFKRRNGLIPLVEADASIEKEGEVFEEFFAEFSAKYQGDTARSLLPLLAESEVHEIAEKCWSFNKPLWLVTPQQALLVSDELKEATGTNLALAAKLPVVRSSDSIPSQFQQTFSAESEFNDEERFAAIFPNYASGKDGKKYLQNILNFLDVDSLGSLRAWTDFLRFIRMRIQTTEYKPSEAFNPDNLRKLFREYQSEKFNG